MKVLPSIISVIFSIGFLLFLLMFAWYIAIPLVLLFTIIGLFNFFRGKPVFEQVYHLHQTFPNNRNQNFTRSSTSKEKKDDKIIDVDYVELN